MGIHTNNRYIDTAALVLGGKAYSCHYVSSLGKQTLIRKCRANRFHRHEEGGWLQTEPHNNSCFHEVALLFPRMLFKLSDVAAEVVLHGETERRQLM